VDTRFTFSASGGNAPSFTLTSHTIQLIHSGY
jgi:hypothetical protein